MYQATVRNSMSWDANSSMRSDWNFDTIKTSSIMGTFRSLAKDLSSMSESSEDEYPESGQIGSIDTGGATKGSEPLVNGGLGSNLDAAHSTVVIKPTSSPVSEKDIETLLAMEPKEPSPSDSPSPPPAYTGSVRNVTRRSSYAERHSVNGAGTVMKEGDLGTGVDTIRPVKKVDTAGSLRVSAEHVGSLRRGSTGSTGSPTSHKRAASELGRAGVSIVDEVVLPVLHQVRLRFFYRVVLINVVFFRLSGMIWMLEKSNL